MLNYTPLRISPKKTISKSFVAMSLLVGLFAFGVLGFMGYMISSIQFQNAYLTDKLDTLTSKKTNNSTSQGEVAGAETSTAEALPPEAEGSRLKIESMISIPVKGETPTFALLDNMTKVQNEPFFKKAALGDHVFIYPKSKIAILYRPSALKIINMAEINSPQPTPTTQNSDSAQMESDSKDDGSKIKLMLVSSGANQETVQQSRDIIMKDSQYEIVDSAKSTSSEVLKKNRLVNVKGDAAKAQALMKKFSAEAGDLPSGIDANGADFVLILAKD
ncbi:MAG: hypothetical protein U0525_01420 [Patescibacteria group bacterium]